MSDFLHPEKDEPISDQRRAFLEYKRRVEQSGKPFFPNGVWHDVIAASIVLAILIVLSVVWFSTANCDSWWNVSCDRVSTPLEQEFFTPDNPGSIPRDKSGAIDHEAANAPLLGLLYEDKADPATTSYHPRPEWYFYFLFYLLVLFKHPEMVVLGTIIVPTVWLVMLMALPIVDRRKERRPSRRPFAMALMLLSAVMLLSFTYLGSQSGKEAKGGPTGLTEEQMAMPGYVALFDEGFFETCASCHQLGGIGNSGPGPALDTIGTQFDSADEIVTILAKGMGGGAMPVKGGTSMTDEQAAHVAAFLKTLGKSGDASSLGDYGVDDWNRVAGSEDKAAGAKDKDTNPATTASS